jgi:hypothetical protein
MTLVETTQILGNIGEFIGAIAVVLTLFYLAVQVRHSRESVDANTRVLEEGRKLAMVQTFQARAEIRINQLLTDADSEYLLPIMDKLHEAGWPENKEAFESLSTLEQRRARAGITAGQRQFDNFHYQYQQGLVEPEHWNAVIVPAIRLMAPGWREVNSGYRPSFKREVERILTEQERDSGSAR